MIEGGKKEDAATLMATQKSSQLCSAMNLLVLLSRDHEGGWVGPH